MKIALWFHIMGVVVWVGGMFFAYTALRPAAGKLLEPAQRLPLWAAVFGRFFPWVWLSVGFILASGLYMLFALGGFASAPRHTHLMTLLGVLMMAVFGYVWFIPFRRLRRHVTLKDWPHAGVALNQIRLLVATNLTLGLITIAIATLGALSVRG